MRESDILLHVVDIAHPAFEDQIHVVTETLKELEAAEKPTILIFNKMDLYEERTFDKYLTNEIKTDILNELKNTWMQKSNAHYVFISATEKNNIEELRTMLTDLVKEQYQIRYPYKTAFFY